MNVPDRDLSSSHLRRRRLLWWIWMAAAFGTVLSVAICGSVLARRGNPWGDGLCLLAVGVALALGPLGRLVRRRLGLAPAAPPPGPPRGGPR